MLLLIINIYFLQNEDTQWEKRIFLYEDHHESIRSLSVIFKYFKLIKKNIKYLNKTILLFFFKNEKRDNKLTISMF